MKCELRAAIDKDAQNMDMIQQDENPAPGVPFEVTEGKCTLWYDGPQVFWVHGPVGDLHAFALAGSTTLNADYAALAMGPAEIRAWRDQGVDMRTLMSVFDARLFAVRRLPDHSLQAWRLQAPLHDRDLPEHGLTRETFDLWPEEEP